MKELDAPTRIKYPDGQISAKMPLGFVRITERINSYEDLIYVRSLAEANGPGLECYIPCLFGQRSDRRFSPDQSFDLKIIAEILNACQFSNVEILDPHSDVALALINNSDKISPKKHIYNSLLDCEGTNNGEVILVSPDAGAYKKVFELGEAFNREVVAAVKHRDANGKIDLKFMGNVENKNCLIVDDLIDGGYTFKILSHQLKEQGAKSVCLYVSHGYFSKGLDDLKKSINHIYCTNSVKDISDPFITQYKVI